MTNQIGVQGVSTAGERISLNNDWKGSIYRDWLLPSNVTAAWEELLKSYDDNRLFISPGWFENWWKAFGRTGELLLFVLEKDGAIKGIFPCLNRSCSDKKMEITALTNDHTCYYDFIVDPGVRFEVIYQFSGALDRFCHDKTFFFEHMLATGDNFGIFLSMLSKRRMPSKTFREPWAPWMAIPGDPETFFKGLPTKELRNIRRKRKRAAERGGLVLDIVRQSDQLDFILDQLFQIEYNSWKGREGSAIKCRTDVENFYKCIAKWAMQNEQLLLFILKIGKDPIAMSFNIRSGRSLYALKTGYDDRYKDISPGQLLFSEMIEHFIKTSECSIFNFLGPCMPWKLFWTEKTHEYGWVKFFPNSLKGRGQYALRFGWKDFLMKFDVVKRITGRSAGIDGINAANSDASQAG